MLFRVETRTRNRDGLVASTAAGCTPSDCQGRNHHIRSLAGEVRERGDQALDPLTNEGDGDLLISGHNPAAHHDPLTQAPMDSAIAG